MPSLGGTKHCFGQFSVVGGNKSNKAFDPTHRLRQGQATDQVSLPSFVGKVFLKISAMDA
jgi:hypothetical protein